MPVAATLARSCFRRRSIRLEPDPDTVTALLERHPWVLYDRVQLGPAHVRGGTVVVPRSSSVLPWHASSSPKLGTPGSRGSSSQRRPFVFHRLDPNTLLRPPATFPLLLVWPCIGMWQELLSSSCLRGPACPGARHDAAADEGVRHHDPGPVLLPRLVPPAMPSFQGGARPDVERGRRRGLPALKSPAPHFCACLWVGPPIRCSLGGA